MTLQVGTVAAMNLTAAAATAVVISAKHQQHDSMNKQP